MDIRRPTVKRPRYRSPVLVPAALSAKTEHKKKVKLPLGIVDRFACLVFSLLMLVSLFTAITPSQGLDRYALSPEIRSLIGSTDPELSKKLTYDPAKQLYQYNSQGGGSGGTPAAGIPDMSLKASAGAENFGLDMPKDPAKGLITHDLKNDMSVKLIPLFKLRQGRQSDDNRVVYPLANGGQLIYSIKGNGIKEDMVLTEKTADTLSFSYRLELPKTMEARLLDNGDIGIYGGDASLFGNISYGSDEDRAKVELAREKSAKNNLLFAIPAPVIVESSPSKTPPTASFGFTDNVLTVNTRGLEKANYPLSIDPSVVVTSANDFTTGNQEGNIEFDASSSQIKRGGLKGGSVGAWSTDAGTFTTQRYGHTTVVSNGYLYVMGGQNGNTVLNDVQYAKFGSSGALASDAGCGTVWCTTTSFTNGRVGSRGFSYNGYIYVTGGYDASWYNDVQYAKPGPAGALEANAGCGTVWCTTSAFATNRSDHMIAVHNGAVYLFGGCSSVLIVTCNVFPNDVQYAQIKGNGALGTWTATGNFPSPRQFAGVAVYNGYIYVTGGFNGSAMSDTYYAPINSDGTIPATNWVSTTGIANARFGHTVVADGGYLYVIGGADTNSVTQTEVKYAPINANGTLGGWITTNSFTNSRFYSASVSNDGYIYIVGGCSSLSVTCSTHYNDTQYAKIDLAGVTATWNTTSAFTTARYSLASVAYNGYIYATGGYNGSFFNDVQYAPLNSDGTVGTWTATTSFTTARFGHTATAYNGYMYIMGGCSSVLLGCSGLQADVQYAPINTNGTIGTWTATTSFTTPRVYHASAVSNGYLYILGGDSGSGYLSDVQYAPINSNGTVGTWNATTSFSTGRISHGAVVSGGYIYVIGGCSAGTCSSLLSDVQYAPINSNGTVGTWNATTSLPNGRYNLAAVTSKGYIYVLGGFDGSTLNDTKYAAINANGTIGSWNTTTSFGTARIAHSAAVYKDYIYVVGGASAGPTPINDVQYAPINNGGRGTVSSWSTNANSFITARYWHASAAYNGYIYILGGTNGTTFNDVQYAPINANGTIGTWTATTSFSTARYEPTAHAYNGYLYILGGGNGSNTFNDVQYAPINANGTIGTWTATTSFTTSRQDHASAIYNGYMYIMGGANQGGAKLNDVQYAPINANGTIGTWTATSSFTTVRQGLTSVTANGYIYILGGWTNANGTHYDDVQYAAINSNGTLGTWVSTTKMLGPRGNHASFISNGFVYVIGGCSSGGCATPVNDVWYAPLNASGGLGAWQSSTALSVARNYHTGLVYNGYIYILGGFVSGGSQNDVLISGQEAIPRSAKYSLLFNCGGDCVATKLYYRGNIVNNSDFTVGYKVATNSSGIFGASTNVQGLASNALKTLNTSENQYYQLNFRFDDSQSAVFPDTSGVSGSMSDFEMFYHPTSAKRLRGGKTFTNQQQQSLDVQP